MKHASVLGPRIDLGCNSDSTGAKSGAWLQPGHRRLRPDEFDDVVSEALSVRSSETPSLRGAHPADGHSWRPHRALVLVVSDARAEIDLDS